MKLLLATHRLEPLGGTETYLLTVAEHLGRLGHEAVLHAPALGQAAEVARARGLVVAEAAELERPDAVLAQDGASSLELAERFPQVPQVFVAHSPVHDLQLPPQVPGLVHAAVALNDVVAGRLRAMAAAPHVVRLRQPIDLRRFAVKAPPSTSLTHALVLGNYLRGERFAILEYALAELGVRLERRGRHGTPTERPEEAMARADLVVGHGRSAFEGMACGRPVLVYDQWGGDGLVDEPRYPAFEANGFAGTGGVEDPAGLQLETLRAELQAWRPELGEIGRGLAVRNHSAAAHARQLVELCREAVPAAQAPDSAAEMARLIRAAHQWEARAGELDMEIERLRATHADLSRQLHELRTSRRHRLGTALMRPADALRRH